MALTITRNGYGQVEPNQLSAQKTGQIYASLPLDETVNVLENGTFMYYSGVLGKVTSTASGAGIAEPYLIFNEVKLYDGTRNQLKDFALIRVGDDYITQDARFPQRTIGGITPVPNPTVIRPKTDNDYRMVGFAPRCFKTNIGDIFTTNMVDTTGSYSVGDELFVKEDTTKHVGVLAPVNGNTPDATNTMRWVVIKETTMPDGQPALKLQRVA